MLYLNDEHIDACALSWNDLANVIEESVAALSKGDYHQPIKPYLRFGEAVNRIIAMPAYLGGSFDAAGIKWIASFPKNIEKGIKRAHSVTILNDALSGRPVATFNTARISGIRTAAVTAYITRWYMQQRNLPRIKVGMTGFGPIGQLHLDMMAGLYGDRIECYRIFDLRPIPSEKMPTKYPFPVEVVSSWQEAYVDTDVFITCTVSSAPYVDKPPKPGSLLNNVSLRDFKASMRKYVQVMLVDDWDEICRENTDVEMMHIAEGLNREDTIDLASLPAANLHLGVKDTVMFNPMGLAIFDIAIAKRYFDIATQKQIGINLPD